MRFLYSLLITLSTPFVLLYFAMRGLRDRAYLDRWKERFGFIQAPKTPGGILLHAASVGEYNTARPLVMALLGAYPEMPLTVTTSTPTGSERVRQSLDSRVNHIYLPLDLPTAVSRFLDRLQPGLIIVMETEIWPNLYRGAQRRDIPLLIANARLSRRSVKRFGRSAGLMQKMLQSVNWIGAQSAGDVTRLIQCGAVPKHTVLAGNLKYEIDVPAGLSEQSEDLRSRWGRQRPVLVAGSTHEADEGVVIPAFIELLEQLPDALLILVPRHPERFSQVAQTARDIGLHVSLRSESESCSELTQCFVIDAMGELMLYYACADVVFVGGSIGAEGGHNPLEPAVLGKPILMGPRVENNQELFTQLVACGAALSVSNWQDFQQATATLLGDRVLRECMGRAGQALVANNRQALELTLKVIEQQLTKPSHS